MVLKLSLRVLLVIIVVLILKLCCPANDDSTINSIKTTNKTILLDNVKPNVIVVEKDIIIDNYFKYIDSIVEKYNPLKMYHLSEHLIVRNNSWIIDTLQNTDYYRMKVRDSFVYNQKKMIALPKGAIIVIPDSIRVSELLNSFQKTIIDINIPEFKLRIFEDTLMRYEFPVRVGRDEEKYLEMSGRIQDLKTKTGKGFIVNHFRNPVYANPVTNKEYFVTKRDDKKVTRLPQIPFIETEINGIKNGQLIHPTTNPITLGKAYSNGCIGVKEADAWVIYYYSPINTKVRIRYDLNVIDKKNRHLVLEDIYGYNKK